MKTRTLGVQGPEPFVTFGVPIESDPVQAPISWTWSTGSSSSVTKSGPGYDGVSHTLHVMEYIPRKHLQSHVSRRALFPSLCFAQFRGDLERNDVASRWTSSPRRGRGLRRPTQWDTAEIPELGRPKLEERGRGAEWAEVEDSGKVNME